MDRRDVGSAISAEARYRTLVEQIPAIVYMAEYGIDGDWLFMSPQIETILGFTPEEWLAHPAPLSTFLHPEDRDRAFAEEAQRIRSREGLRSEYRLYTRSGDVVWIRYEATLMFDDAGRPLFWQGVMYDITAQKRAEAEVAYLAYHDKLTALPNRAMFEELLGLALARAARQDLAVAVLSLDLDRFKVVNNSLGHEAGDRILAQIAERLRLVTRDSDVVACKGGDEFLILLADLPLGPHDGNPEAPEAALVISESVAARIHEQLEAPFVLGETECFVTTSIGIGAFPHHCEDASSLMKAADAAMDRSKRQAPGGYVIHAKEPPRAVSELSFSTRLRRAVDRGDWVLYYQPLVDLATRQITGVEALVRWAQANGGLIPPGEFIPLAEEMG